MNSKLFLTTARFLYCLKHFNKIDKQTEVFLLKNGMDESTIIQQLNTLGSKFFYSFAHSPESILNKITERVPSQIIHQKNGNIVYIYLFEQTIGYDSLISVKNLSTKELNLIEIENRNQKEVRVLRKNKRNKTYQLNVIFQKNNNEIITMFPGVYAPPLPTSKMESEEFLQATIFWEEHIFIS
jgi:hypothetical protein